MSTMRAPARRVLLLAELGIVRYRLRSPRKSSSSDKAIAENETAVAEGAKACPPATRRALAVNAAGMTQAPTGAIEAAIWTQVLLWLGYRADEIDWSRDDGAIALPPTRNWSTPQGKRGLWNALKAHVREDR
jgi:hypothetical protein